jgi:hypothetical protein
MHTQLRYSERREYFMSNEQEAALKWGMFEKYKALTAKQAALQYKMREWGDSMAVLADELRRGGAQDGIHIIQTNSSHMPTKEQIMGAVTELDILKKDIHETRHQLKLAGMDLDKLG